MAINAIILLWVAYRLCRFVYSLQRFGFLAGYRPLFDPYSPPGNAIPTCWWNPGFLWPWIRRQTAYFNHEHEVVSMIPLLAGGPSYLLSSVEASRQLLGSEGKTQLIKSPEFTTVGLWGDSVASVSGEDWKRHRRSAAPSFNSTMLSLVTEECQAVYNEMVASEGWHDVGGATSVHINRIMARFTFVILSRCGFGIPASWKMQEDQSDSTRFEIALTTASETFLARVLLPRWAYWLPVKRLHEIDAAWRTVTSLMGKFAEVRKADLADSGVDLRKKDVFTRLVLASDDGGKFALTTTEVTANMLSLLFAGYETTSSALVTTLTMLAIHQEDQARVFSEIVEQLPAEGTVTNDSFKSLKFISACIQEAHRLIPVAGYLARDTLQDVVISVKRPRQDVIVIPKGSRVLVDQLSVLHDPHEYPDPDKYIPSRWLNVADQDVPMFGFGPRSCLGRKFATTEMICLIALFLRDWKVDIVLDEGDTYERYHARLLETTTLRNSAFGVGDVSLKVTPRR
ncbi:hypothetical protein HYDPIDRAFT_161547 [Hydnomerulius pinastri MD-312]|uniref:Cytochrome P450 n=1 Tax=Hydnomerulius pinastri MD-312 TaxID=994086 RepID=A0A0C9VQP9_9AGAM|nr:hypothetical protein HYDPIDRAFT_161547 [Hydnomerulius pinastri MD-312]